MKKIIRFLPSIIWMLLIFYLSSQQTTGIGGDSYWGRFFILKSFHIIEYAILFILLFFAINLYNYSFYISAIYALSDEFHQKFTIGRMASLRDVLIDILGIYIGIVILKKMLKINYFRNLFFKKK